MTATGRDVQHLGQRQVKFFLWGVLAAQAKFQVCNVRRPILSVGMLNDQGIVAHFDPEAAVLKIRGVEFPLLKIDRLFYLPVSLELMNGKEALEPVAAGLHTDGTPVGKIEAFVKEMWKNKRRGDPIIVEWCCHEDSKISATF